MGEIYKQPPSGGITWRETMRIYIVGMNDGVRLIRATNRQQAVSHVARQIIVAKVATQDELVKHITAGVAVENYKAPDQQELDLGE